MRLAAIEEKLDLVLARMGLDGNASSGPAAPGTAVACKPGSAIEADPQLIALVQAGKKIQAIKVYRQATGAGLRDAKDAVDALEQGMGGGNGRRR